MNACVWTIALLVGLADEAPAKAARHLDLLVIDAATKKPIAGAIVRIFGGERPTPYQTTDAHGKTRIAFSPVHPSLALDVHAEKYVQQRLDWSSVKSAVEIPASFTAALHAGTGVMGGRVVDESGKPVAGATVRLGAYLPKPRRLAANVVELICDIDATTDADGRWRVASLDGVPKSIRLRVMHSEFVQHESDRDGAVPPVEELMNQSATLRLAKGVEVRGRVVSHDGKPIAGARVVADDRLIDASPRRFTEADGTFRFGGMRAGRALLTVQAKGFGPQQRQLDRLRETTEVEFRLGPPRTIAGRVVDGAGKPIAGTTCFINFATRPSALQLWTQSDADGRYSIADAPSEPVRMHASKEGYRSEADTLVDAGATVCDFVLKPNRRIRGSVTDAVTGMPIADFTASYWFTSGGRDVDFSANERLFRVRGKNGNYEIECYQRTRTEIQVGVWASGYQLARSKTFLLERDEYVIDLKLTPERRPAVAGVVRQPDGAPAEGALVIITTANRRGGFETGRPVNDADQMQRTGADGRFEFPPQEGEFVLAATHPTGYVERYPPAVAQRDEIVAPPRNDGPTTIELKLAAWAVVEGVFHFEGKPGANLRISFESEHPFEHGKPHTFCNVRTTTDREGRFRLDRVPPLPGKLTQYKEPGGGRGGSYLLISALSPKAGETIRLPHARIAGRTVVGYLSVPTEIRELMVLPGRFTDNLAQSDRPWVPYPPEVVKQGDKARSEWSNQWHKSPEGKAYYKNYKHHAVWINPDGAFRIDGATPEKYLLNLTLRQRHATDADTKGEVLATVEHRFEVVANPKDNPDTPLDLGTIPVAISKAVRIGRPAPDIVAQALDGKPWRLADHRGKVVLLDFWATWCGPCIAAMPELEILHRRFADNPKFLLVGLSVDEEAAKPAKFIADKGYKWQQVHLGPKAPVLEPLGIEGYPTVMLISADGKILSRGHRLEDIASRIEALLGK